MSRDDERIAEALRDAIGDNDVEGDLATQAANREHRFWLRLAVLRAGRVELLDREPDQLRGDLTDELAAIVRTGHASPRALALVADFLQSAPISDSLLGRLLGVRTTGRPNVQALHEARCCAAFELARHAGGSIDSALRAAYDARKDSPGAYDRDDERRKVTTVGAKQVSTTLAADYMQRHVKPALRRAGLLHD